MQGILANKTSRIIGLMLSIVMLAGLITFMETTAANACGNPADMCANNISQNSPDYNNGGGGGGGGCGTDINTQPWVECGWVNFNRSGPTSPNGSVGSGLPGTKWGLKVDSIYYKYGGVYDAPARVLNTSAYTLAYNTTPACMNTPRTYIDPVSGSARSYYPDGASWVDTVNWGYQQTYSYSDRAYQWEKHRGNILVYNNGSEWEGIGVDGDYATGIYVYRWSKPTSYYGGPTSPYGFGTMHPNSYWYSKTDNNLHPYNDVYSDVRITYSRDVQYYCHYPAAPYSTYKTCPTDIQGTMQGPYDNAATNPRFPVLIAPGQFDPKTQPKDWHIPMYSDIGNAYRVYGTALSPSNWQAYSLVVNCQPMYYNVTVGNAQCWWANSPGPWYDNNLNPIGGLRGAENCSFTPGNYIKQATGSQITCKYGVYPAGYGYSGNQFVGCGEKSINPTAYYSGQAWWCSIAPNGQNGWNTTGNFATDCKDATPPNCTWSNGTGALTITDPYGVVQPSGVQVQADGKVWTVTAPTLNCPGAQNQWQQWVVGKNSKPSRSGLTANDATQPVWGSYTRNGVASFTVYAGSSVGSQGWGQSTFYLRFNQATVTNDTNNAIVVGADSSNPVSVPSGSAIPFGLYFLYHYSLTDTASSNVGGTVNFNNFKSISTPMVTFYSVSGRVTG